MVESNIKKRLLHIQNISKEMLINNIWIQPGYLYSRNKNDFIMGRYDSKLKGISIGAEDSSNIHYDICIGFCYSYAQSNMQSNNINKVDINTNSYIFSSYASLIYNRFIYDLQFNYVKSQNNRIRIDMLGYNYLSVYNNYTFSLEVSTGKKFQLENNMVINCKLLCNLFKNKTSPYKETSASDSLDYQIFPHVNNKISLGIEATFYGSIYIYETRINPEFFANIKFNLLKDKKIYDVNLYSYKSTTEIVEKNKLNIKIGIGILSNINSFNIRLDYFFKTNLNLKTHMVNGNLSYYF
jgi:outer membrane autotransporter protein